MKRNTLAAITITIIVFLVGVFIGVILLGAALKEPFGPEQRLIDVIERYHVCNKDINPDEICFLLPVRMAKEDLQNG